MVDSQCCTAMIVHSKDIPFQDSDTLVKKYLKQIALNVLFAEKCIPLQVKAMGASFMQLTVTNNRTIWKQ